MRWLSKIFGQRESKQTELSIKQLPRWVDNKVEQRLKAINEELKTLFEKIEDRRKKTFESLDKLAKAQLQNLQLITRAKQIMAGNRESYIKKVKLFLERIAVPEVIIIDSTKRYIEDYDEAIKELTKTSTKSYYVVSEFFGNEIGVVARNIKEIDEQVKKIVQFVKENENEIVRINKLKEIVSSIETSKQQISKLKQEIEDSNQEKQSVGRELKQTQTRIVAIKKSKAFAEYNELLKKKKEREEQLQGLEQNIFSQFSVLERALKKYSKITLEERLVNNYLEDFLEALWQDRELKILEVLQKIRDAIEREELELKDKKKEKTLEQINKINKQDLSNFKDNHKMVLGEIKQMESLMKMNKANLEIKELEYKLEHINTRLENMDKEEKLRREQLEKLDVEKITRETKEKIKDIFGVEIIIVQEK